MRNPDRLVWSLIGATALVAMAFGHALELWLERLGMFGDGQASYAHPMQTIAVEAAAVVLVVTLAAIVRRLARYALRSGDEPDYLVPALDGIVRLGLMRTSAALVATQFCALVAIELFEQHWSGFHGGLAAIVGAGHATAIAVHILVGLLCALVLYRVSRFMGTQTRKIVGAIATFLRLVSLYGRVETATSQSCVAWWLPSRKPALLALGLANRPPPVTSANAA